jgi:ABC-2 type transport system permease protein
MITTLRSEFRKLYSVRSTYWITGIVLILIILLAGYGGGYKEAKNATPFVFSESLGIITVTFSLFVAVVGVLLMAHEYRYNTIIYTLMNSNSRTKVLISKIIAVVVYALIFTALVMGAALGSLALGAQLAGHPLPHQEVNYLLFFVKAFFYFSGFALVGLLFATLIRNLVASVVALFILPNLVETLANLLLKKDSVYMPFSALNQVITTVPPEDVGPFVAGSLSPLKGAIVFLIWLVAGWLITWALFLRRDAL